MRKIAHRGNMDGPNILENSPLHIQRALDEGYYVEIDVRYIDEKLYLGHDNPQYLIDLEFLKNEKIYVHAKSVETLVYLLNFPSINVFFHDKDDVTLTSNKEVWTNTHCSKKSEKSICVILERLNTYKKYENCFGICTDYVKEIDI